MTRSSAATGIPDEPMVRAINFVLYFFASRGTFSRRSGSAEVELMIGWALVTFWRPASIPRMFVLSRRAAHLQLPQPFPPSREYFLPVCFGPMFRSSLRPSFHLFYGQILKKFGIFLFESGFNFSEIMWMFSPKMYIFLSPFS